MKPEHKVLFEFVNKCLLLRQERRHTANYMDLVFLECLVRGKQINWPTFIVKLLDRVIKWFQGTCYSLWVHIDDCAG